MATGYLTVDQYLGNTPSSSPSSSPSAATPQPTSGYSTLPIAKAPTTTGTPQLSYGTGTLAPMVAPMTDTTASQSAAPSYTPAPLSTSDPLAFAPAPSALPTTDLSPSSPATFPTTSPAPSTTAPAATSGYGGTGTYGNLDYADAVQAAYRAQQAQEAATGVDATPIDYSMQGLSDAGLWGMSAADTAANAARTQSIISDPTSTAAAKELASLPGYGTPAFDQQLNNGSNPALAQQVQTLLGQSAAEHVATPAPTGEDYLVGGVHYNNLADAQAAEAALAAGTSSGDAGGAGGSSTGPRLSPGAANDAGAPSSGVGATFGSGTTTGGSSSSSGSNGLPATTGLPTTSATQAGNNGVVTTPIDPNNALTGQVISPGPGTDRFAIAQTQLQDFINSSDPAYQASLRDANRYNFSEGRGISGIATNSLGDLATQRQNAIQQERDTVLGNALTGSIDDAYRNIGIAQQQQGFERLMQNDAFQQALEQLTAGSSGDPASTALVLAQIFGQQGSASGQVATNYATSSQNAQSQQDAYNAFIQWLNQMQTSGTDPLAGIDTTVPPISITPGYTS